MTEHPLEALVVRSLPLKRAQYEAFAFSLFQGDILVRNESHADPSNHEYLVTVEDAIPTACECPADTKYDGACKHRLAVAIRPRILEAVKQIQVAANDGLRTDQGRSGDRGDTPYDVQRFDGNRSRKPVRRGRRFHPDERPVDGL